ncbi:MAG: hypothetical protein WC729_28830 [Sphingomonas sp.]|uniref:hypothetical protein n=1 Tax=Sphingomonas sp. TaxID=28214 RepID=UPI003565DF5F
MRGATRRRRYAILVEAAGDGRGARFARRRAGKPGPRFADIAKVPDWLSAEPGEQHRIAILAALLRYRRAIDAELSGARLAALAAAVGEDLLDAACEAPAPDRVNNLPLPQPERLHAEGRALLHAALPLPFAQRFPDALDDPQARDLAARASRIVAALA